MGLRYALAELFQETLATFHDPQDEFLPADMRDNFHGRQPLAGMGDMRTQPITVIGENLAAFTTARDADVKLLLMDGGQRPRRRHACQPRRAAAASLRFARAHQLRRGNPQGGGDGFKLIVSQRDGAAFPLRVRPLGEADFLGELRLGKPDLFAQVVQALSERWARKLGGSAGVHARIIRAGGQS